jgi:hypothetical protein
LLFPTHAARPITRHAICPINIFTGCFCGFATIICALCLIHFFKTDSNASSSQLDQIVICTNIDLNSDNKQHLSFTNFVAKWFFSKMSKKYSTNREYLNDGDDMMSVDSSYVLLPTHENDVENKKNDNQGSKLI